MILVVSEPDDDHAGAVADLLRAEAREVEHIAVPSLSADTTVELEIGATGTLRRGLRVSGRTAPIDLGTATTGFWRRRHAPVLSRDLAALAEVDGAPVESTESFESVTASLGLRWMNDPVRDHVGRRRPRQWEAAVASGLAVPDTLVTRDPVAAIAFRDAHLADGIVAKPLARRIDDWAGCRVVGDEAELVHRMRRSGAETVLQTRLDGPDVRVIVVAGQHFPVEIDDSGDELPADLAVDEGRVRPTLVPPTVLAAIDALLARLGLVVAAVDLRRGADGRLFFIDLDPTPRWLLLEELTGWPVTEAVVEALAVRDGALARR